MATEPATSDSSKQPAVSQDAPEPNPRPLTPEPARHALGEAVADGRSDGERVLETTTAKDGALPINSQGSQAAAQSSTEPSFTSVPVPVVAAPETPIMVSEAEVKNPTVTASNDVTAEIENLSGEIQALEAKIDRLTGNVKPVNDKAAPDDRVPGLVPSAPAIAPATPPPPAPIPKTPTTGVESKTVTVNDIYSKVADKGKEEKADKAEMNTGSDDAEEVGSGMNIGVIGEVLMVFGVLIFMIMGGSPFFKSALPESIASALQSIGWPTAVASLALGFILSLFTHGKWSTKILGLLLTLIAAMIYMGVAGYQSYLGPLGTMLDSVFSFYR